MYCPLCFNQKITNINNLQLATDGSYATAEGTCPKCGLIELYYPYDHSGSVLKEYQGKENASHE